MKTCELKLSNIKTATEKQDLVFVNIDEAPFKIYGVYRDGDYYRRIPSEIAEKCNSDVIKYQSVTAGGRVRFVTDSPYISVRVTLTGAQCWDIMPDAMVSGADVYVGTRFHSIVNNSQILQNKTDSLLPGAAEYDPEKTDIAYETLINLGDTNGQTVTINMPVFNGVKNMHIGLKKGSEISHAPAYNCEKPVVFYGSSITHGACASRPGLTYENILARELDFNYTNLGFAGGARAEKTISEYIASLDMSVFVYDYDYNAPTPEYLESTHSRMFAEFRKNHPKTPVLMLTHPYGKFDTAVDLRQKIIKKTYDDARALGDENVYFLSASEYFPKELGMDFSVDTCHPSDVGFMFMAKAIKPILEKILSKI